MKNAVWLSALMLILVPAVPLAAQEAAEKPDEVPEAGAAEAGLVKAIGDMMGRYAREIRLTNDERRAFEAMTLEKRIDFLAQKRVEQLERQKVQVDGDLARAKENLKTMAAMTPPEKMDFFLDRMFDRYRRVLARMGKTEEEIEDTIARRKQDAVKIAMMTPEERRAYYRERWEKYRAKARQETSERLGQALVKVGLSQQEANGILDAAKEAGRGGPEVVRDKVSALLKGKGMSEQEIEQALRKLREAGRRGTPRRWHGRGGPRQPRELEP
jgi:hypothetical protein